MRSVERKERGVYEFGSALGRDGKRDERDEDAIRAIGTFPFEVEDEVAACVKRL